MSEMLTGTGEQGQVITIKLQQAEGQDVVVYRRVEGLADGEWVDSVGRIYRLIPQSFRQAGGWEYTGRRLAAV